MSGQGSFIDDAEQRARWEAFQWTEENARKVKEIIARYPQGRQMSASIPLLDLAQRYELAANNFRGLQREGAVVNGAIDNGLQA